MERIGILAGAGKLPVECARAAKQLGYEVYAVGLLAQTDAEIANFAKDYQQISVGQLDAILNYLQQNELKKITMIGKVTKELLFNGAVIPDARMLQLIMSLPDRKDDTIMLAFVRELAKAGMETFDQTALIRKLMPHRGTITSREPSETEKADMEFGFMIAKELGRLDIGQTAVVKNRAVMALEAIEGTDECIVAQLSRKFQNLNKITGLMFLQSDKRLWKLWQRLAQLHLLLKLIKLCLLTKKTRLPLQMKRVFRLSQCKIFLQIKNRQLKMVVCFFVR